MRQLALDNRNIVIFYILSITRSAVFLNGNWIFFWLRVMTYGQLGVVDAASFAFGLVMEIPTGAISDMIGKRPTLMLAMLLNGVGFIIMGMADTLTVLVIGFWVSQVGWAFYSGADEALAYDTLKETEQEHLFDKVISASNTMGIITLIICSLIGGVMYNMNVRLPHLAWGGVLLLGFIAAIFLREPHVKRKDEGFSLRAYGAQLMRGFQQLTQPELRVFLPLIFGILGTSYLFGFGLIQPAIATHFGFSADEQSVLVAVMAGATAVATAFIPALRRRVSEMTMLVALTMFMAAAWIGTALPVGYLGGAAVLILIRVVGGMANPWVSIIVNHKIPSQDRATTLSTVALLIKIPYVLTAIIAGWMSENGVLWVFSLGVALFLLLMIGISAANALTRLKATVEKPEAIV